MDRFWKAAFAGAVLLWGWLGAAGAVGAAPALWRVKTDRAEVFLFGTLHALPPQLAWRTPAYDAAYARADTVWFEAALDAADPQLVRGIVDRYGVDRDRPLSRKLPAGALAELQRRQIDIGRIDHLRPWAAALMLSMRPALSRGATVQAGADLTITRAARREEKAVRTFETLEDQARLFASLSEGAEVRYLTDVIAETRPRRRLLPWPTPESLQEAWLEGDLPRLGPALVGRMRSDNPGLYDVLLKQRNQAWAEALERELREGEGVDLVNVGALHLVGQDGLPALLAQRGFKVERVQ